MSAGEDREEFRRLSAGSTSLDDVDAAKAAWAELNDYMLQLVDVKRRNPAEDVFSDLVAAQEREGLEDAEIARMASGILFAGHETTVTRLDLGTLLLLTHPEQRAKLQADPQGHVQSAVEEILRMAAPSTQDVLPRYAHEDIQVGDLTIPEGDLVLLAFTATNRDPDIFSDPNSFDITRDSTQHLAFGHGPRFCLGSGLARLELQIVYSTLFERLPGLQLATGLDELQFRDNTLTGGLSALHVRW